MFGCGLQFQAKSSGLNSKQSQGDLISSQVKWSLSQLKSTETQLHKPGQVPCQPGQAPFQPGQEAQAPLPISSMLKFFTWDVAVEWLGGLVCLILCRSACTIRFEGCNKFKCKKKTPTGRGRGGSSAAAAKKGGRGSGAGGKRKR
ncbi:unnamed protein product [Prunus armeniaca]|uniref:Uncharacterized protein n=1 Tax=Prunus armeniaca TaxID=36596 RepID=A0A6J5Y9F9_PRUAR|nr:unnamed protein product [Prunus armeniaca]